MYKTNKVKSLLLLMILYFSASLISKAQDTTKVSKETQKPLKWEIATDLLWLIDKNTLPKYTLFGRYHYKTKSGKDRAIRVRVGGEFSSNTIYIPNSPSPSLLQEKIKLVARVGYEWRKKYQKTTLIYGLDASLDLNRDYQTANGSNPIGGAFTGSDGDRVLTSQIVAFIGFQYHLSSKISLSMESAFNFGYADSKSLYTRNFVNSGSGSKSSNFALFISNFNLLQVLNLSYHF
ncbi:MAG: hypothetical protein EAZ06_06255 [Cytophagales bacterium]|nr:MAG: hypothetical protein EAZ06_06255 [Cytophagales bacterium]